MKIQTKWFAMFAAAGIGALLLMSLFAGHALAQASSDADSDDHAAVESELAPRPAGHHLGPCPMTAMHADAGCDARLSPMSHTMPMSMTMPAASGGMCQDDKCSMMPDMMQA